MTLTLLQVILIDANLWARRDINQLPWCGFKLGCSSRVSGVTPTRIDEISRPDRRLSCPVPLRMGSHSYRLNVNHRLKKLGHRRDF